MSTTVLIATPLDDTLVARIERETSALEILSIRPCFARTLLQRPRWGPVLPPWRPGAGALRGVDVPSGGQLRHPGRTP